MSDFSFELCFQILKDISLYITCWCFLVTAKKSMPPTQLPFLKLLICFKGHAKSFTCAMPNTHDLPETGAMDYAHYKSIN